MADMIKGSLVVPLTGVGFLLGWYKAGIELVWEFRSIGGSILGSLYEGSCYVGSILDPPDFWELPCLRMDVRFYL